MKNREDRTLKATPETNSRYESTEFHLFDTDATEEKALCGADTSADYRRGVNCCLEDRLDGNWIGTVCEGCKSVAASFAVNRSRVFAFVAMAARDSRSCHMDTWTKIVTVVGATLSAMLGVFLLGPLFNWARRKVQLGRGIVISSAIERGPPTREYGFSEPAITVTFSNASGAAVGLPDIRLRFAKDFGLPVLPEAPPPRSHPTLPTTVPTALFQLHLLKLIGFDAGSIKRVLS